MMKLSILLILTIACLSTVAADKSLDTDGYFAYPRAVVVMESGKTKAVNWCSQCFSHPTPQQPEPRFSGGHEFEGRTSVSWEFVRQTRRGDVYLVAVERPNKPDTVIPVLFTGKTEAVVSDRDLVVRILPDRPKEN